VILFSSKDMNLNKAHVRYLEARLIELAHQSKRADVENAVQSRLPSLSEADLADMEAFLDEMLVIYPLLGVTAFEVAIETNSATELRLVLRAKDTLAYGAERPDGFTVFKGSKGRLEAVPSFKALPYLIDLRRKLLENGVLVQEAGQLVLTQDYQFDSPSSASAVFLGRTSNGRVEWKDGDGRTLRAIQEEAVPIGPS
jgi:hypothetical protein